MSIEGKADDGYGEAWTFDLPDRALHTVLDHLAPHDVDAARAANVHWHSGSTSDYLWKGVAKRATGSPVLAEYLASDSSFGGIPSWRGRAAVWQNIERVWRCVVWGSESRVWD